MTVSRFHVARMDCAAEEQLVRLTLADIEGIERVAVDLHARQVTIDHALEPSTIDAALQTLDLATTHIDDQGETAVAPDARRERHALTVALSINAAFLVVEVTAGLISRSIGLVADALDMGADASVYALSLIAVGTATMHKKRLARVSGYVQIGLAGIGLLEVARRFLANEGLPDATSMIVVSLLALIGNIATLVVLSRVRSGEVHLQAAWIFTANDIRVNALVIVAAVIVLITDSATPDLIAGALIFAIVANGARRILRISR